MNIRKSWLFSLLLVGFLSTAAFSSSSNDFGPESLDTQIQKFLKGMDMDGVYLNETIHVDFMINEKSEIIVLSTDNTKLDSTLKSRLNYKVLKINDLDYLKKYTIPISFKK